MTARRVADPDLMRPREVADAFSVAVKTVTRWRQAGKLSYVLTPGGEHRYSRAEVTALLGGSETRRQVPGGAS